MTSAALAIWLVLNVAPPTVAPKPAQPIKVQDVKRWTVKWLEKPTYTFLGLARGGHILTQVGGVCPDYLSCSGGQSGVLDPDGRPLIAPSAARIDDLRKDGHVFTGANGLGFATNDGRILLEPRYTQITRQGDSHLEVRSKTDGVMLFTLEGRVVLSGFEELIFEHEDRIWAKRGGKWGILDLAGKPLVAYKYQEIISVSERTSAGRVGNRWALLDLSGRQLTPLRYHGFGTAVHGLLVFNLGGDCEDGFDACVGGRYGVLRDDGRTVLPGEHDCVEVFGIGEDDAELRVMKSPEGLDPWALQGERCARGRVRVLRKDGTPWFKDSFAYLDPLDGATHLRAVKDGACDLQGNCERGKWGVLDVAGRVLVDYRYDYIDPPRDDGTLFVLNEKWGLLDGSFKEAIPAKYDMLHLGKDELRFLENGKWGFLDRSGKPVVPAKYDVILPFIKGVARFQEQGKWGLISSAGKVLVPARHVAICQASRETYLFAASGACKVKTGKDLYEPSVMAGGERLRRVGWSDPDCECQEASLGLMDAAGKVLYPPRYQAIRVQTSMHFSDRRAGRVTRLGGFSGLPAGQAWVRLNQGGKCSRLGICVGGKWGVGDLKGRVIVPVTHDYLEPQANFLMRAAKGGPCETHNWQARRCTPETKWGLIRLEPGK